MDAAANHDNSGTATPRHRSSEVRGSVHTFALRKAWVTELKAAGWVLQLAAANASVGPVVFSALSRALRVLGLPTSTCLADASVLDATIVTAPPAGFSHSWGHRMAASPGQDFLLLGGTDRRRLEAVYTLLPTKSEGTCFHTMVAVCP